ncbi:MAG: hypothetical protein V5A44_09050 [Haloarculaceae archaeon]
MPDDASGEDRWDDDPIEGDSDATGDGPAVEGGHLLAVVPWVLLSVAWLALTATKLAGLTTPGAAAGVVFSLALVVAGLAAVRQYGSASAGKALAGVLFAVGGVSTLLSATAGRAAWFPNDVVTVVADVTILAALVLVLALKTETGRDAVSG